MSFPIADNDAATVENKHGITIPTSLIMSKSSDNPSTTAFEEPVRKRVRISESPQVVGLVDALSESEREVAWYTSSEFAASKESVKDLCRSYRQSRRYSDCLTHAYNTACGLADEHERIQKRDKNPVSLEANLPDEVRVMVTGGREECLARLARTK